MALLGRVHKFIVWFFILLAVSGIVLVTIYDYLRGEVLSETGTVTVTGDIPHFITLNIKPESRIPPIGNDELPLTVEIRPPGSLVPIVTVLATANTNGDAYLGTLSAQSVPPGVYDIAVKGLSHLRKVYPNQPLDGPAVRNYLLSLPQLPAGDTNPTADNYVNSLDISYITLNLYNADNRADLTHDGIVNSLDYAALLRNLNTYGDN